MGREYFRIVRCDPPTNEDFKSARDLGKPLSNPRYEREWAEGVSVYDDLEYTIERVIQNRFLLGRFIVKMVVEESTGVEIKQTTRDQRHYSLYGTPEQLLQLVVGELTLVEKGE